MPRIQLRSLASSAFASSLPRHLTPKTPSASPPPLQTPSPSPSPPSTAFPHRKASRSASRHAVLFVAARTLAEDASGPAPNHCALHSPPQIPPAASATDAP